MNIPASDLDKPEVEFTFYLYGETGEHGAPYFSTWIVFPDEGGEIPIYQYLPDEHVVWNSFLTDWGDLEGTEPTQAFWDWLHEGFWLREKSDEETWEDMADHEKAFVNELGSERAPWGPNGSEEMPVEISWLYQKAKEEYDATE